MPELAATSLSGLPTINFQPINPSSYINPAWVPSPLPPDLRKAEAILGHAGVLGAVSKTISELPDTFQKAYSTGQQNVLTAAENQGKLSGLQLKSDILANGVTPEQQAKLQGLTLRPDGSTSYEVPSPYAMETNRLKMDDIRAQVAQRNALAQKALQFSQGGGIENPSLIQPLSSAAATQGWDASEGLSSVGEKPIWTATSYGYSGDHYGGPSARASTTGPMGNKLDDKSTALSQNVEREALAKGYKFGDIIPFTTNSGAVVARRFDDRTAQPDPTGQWSVDDKGRIIIGENGKPLPALYDRVDFHAEPVLDKSGIPIPGKFKPSRYNGIGITGILPKRGSADDSLPLPTSDTPATLDPVVLHPGADLSNRTITANGGERLADVAAQRGVDLTALAQHNGINPNSVLQPKQNVIIPDAQVAQGMAALRLRPNEEDRTPGLPSTKSISLGESAVPAVGLSGTILNPATTPIPLVAAGDDDQPVATAIPVATKVATAPKSDEALLPDGTIHLDKAAAARGGVPIGTGRSGGEVERFNGFDREKLPGGNYTIYPHKLRTPGQADHYDTKLPIQAPAKLRSEAEEMGINVDGMSQGDIGKAMDDKEKSDGVIRPSRLPVAQRMASFVVGHPALKHLPTIREAKETVDSGLANPDAGGFGDMALIEGFQRMVNPGATVRTQTMNNMQQATGWLAQLDPSYQWGKATIGDKLTPAARQRIKVLSDGIYEKTMANARPQLDGLKKLAKSYGINNPDEFINNTLSLTPLLAGTAEPGAPAATPGAPATPAPAAAPAANMVRMQKPPNPDGTPGAIIMVPAANVAAAQALNATIVK